ncbi:MAG: hypothetical protein H6765_06140 [Candidatus Peribacteria bacterium]|nr:MAG: hypothetical protein H6765_06140 [Candidatus Peribacteria bacterium]
MLLGAIDTAAVLAAPEETDELAQEAEILTQQSNGSYLWLLGRMLSAGYIIDEHPLKR